MKDISHSIRIARSLGETGLVVLDTQTDTVASGDTYFASSALAGAAYVRGRLSTAPCALKIQKNTR